MNSYKYDIAISLCKQDVDFARKLIKELNPKLNVFFYEDRQDELISKSGPEAFAKCFKEEARIIVILSRNEWGESYYTEIERNAIHDRTKTGYGFLLVIPMEPGQAPPWYPSTRIYADPKRFSAEQLVKFIEFKVTEEGGIIKPLTSEEYSSYFIDQLKEKKKLIGLQNSSEAVDMLVAEVNKLKTLFNSKAEYFSKNSYQFHLRNRLFNDFTYDAQFEVGIYHLHFEIHNMDYGVPITTQQADLWIKLFKLTSSMQHSEIRSEQYKFFYSETLKGWSIPITYSGSSNIHINHLFTEYGSKWYDLKTPVNTENLLNNWFTELWKYVKQDFDKIL